MNEVKEVKEVKSTEERINDEIIVAIGDVMGVVKHLVDNPDEVRFDIQAKGYSIMVFLYTAHKDVGQVIGANAHLVTSIRSLLTAIAGKHKVKVTLDFVTEGDNRRTAENSPGNEKAKNFRL